MKRLIAIALVVLMAVALLASCGSSGSPEGKYTVKSVGGQTVEEALEEMLGGLDIDDVLKQMGIDSLDDYMTLELKESMQPGIFRSHTDVEYLYLLMPVRM